MADEGLTLRDIKRQERLEKRGGGLGRLPPYFWQQAGDLRTQLQQALRECGPGNSARYIDLHEDLKRLEGLLREITVNRERKLLLAAHEAVSGLRPDLNHLEKREKPLFEDLKRVLGNYRQQVFTGPEPPASSPAPGLEGSLEVIGSEGARTKGVDESPTAPGFEPSRVPLAPSVPQPSPSTPLTSPGSIPTSAAAGVPETASTREPDLQGPTGPGETEPLPDEVGAGQDGRDPLPGDAKQDAEQDTEPPDDTATQLVRVLEDQPPFTGIDAKVYTLKTQDVLTLPAFNARRLAEVGAVAPIESLARMRPENGSRPDEMVQQASTGG